MQFRKTAVAVAIAGIAAVTPQIASADTVLSGAVTIGFFGSDDDTALNDNDLTVGDPRLAVDEGVVGIVATHTMNSGLDAYGSLRMDADGFSGSNTTSDSVYVGIKGGFGDFRMGEVPVAAEYGQVAGDIFDQTGGIDDGLAYTGNFGPATIGVSYSPEQNSDLIGVGAKFGLGPVSVGIGGEERDELVNFSVGGSFALAGASVAVHYVDQEVDGQDDNNTIIGVNVGYGIAGVSLGLSYFLQTVGDDGGGAEDTVVRLDAGYGLGGGMTVSARVNLFSGDGVDAQNADPATGDAVETDYRVLLSKSF